MQNYIVILELPKNIEEKIRTSFENTFDKKISISHLHLTLLPPFSLINKVDLKRLKEVLKSFKSIKISAFFGQPNLFRNPGETILYLPVEPEKEITKLYKKIENESKDLITFETSLYHTDEVPPFLPHVSLDYNFTYNSKTLINLEKNLIIPKFILKKPVLRVRTSSGSWKKV